MARRRRRRNLRAAGATRLSICIGRRTWERTCSYAEACRPTVERVRAITTALFLRVFIHNPVQDCVRFAALQLVLHPDSFRSSNQQLHWPPCKLLHCAHGLLYCEFTLYCDVMYTHTLTRQAAASATWRRTPARCRSSTSSSRARTSTNTARGPTATFTLTGTAPS